MKTSSAKAKGRAFEKALVEMLYEEFPQLEEGDIEWRSMGAGGIDLLLSPAARKLFPVSVEAKNTKKQPGPEAVRQAGANAYINTVPVVAWKPPRANMRDSMMMIKSIDLIWLIKLIRGEQES